MFKVVGNTSQNQDLFNIRICDTFSKILQRSLFYYILSIDSKNIGFEQNVMLNIIGFSYVEFLKKMPEKMCRSTSTVSCKHVSNSMRETETVKSSLFKRLF